jgi:hypothetical protein
MGFKPTITATKWPQTYALDSAATGIGKCDYCNVNKVRNSELDVLARLGKTCVSVETPNNEGFDSIRNLRTKYRLVRFPSSYLSSEGITGFGIQRHVTWLK